MARTPASSLDFNALTVEEAPTFAVAGTPVPDAIQAAVRQSLREGKALMFTVPGEGKDSENVKTLVGYLRRAAEIDKNGLNVRTEDVKRGDKVVQVRVKFQTRAERIQGRGRKPATQATEAAQAPTEG